MDLELASGPANEEAQRSFSKHKEAYEKLRSDVTVKMQFLDENRVSLIGRFFVHNFWWVLRWILFKGASINEQTFLLYFN